MENNYNVLSLSEFEERYDIHEMTGFLSPNGPTSKLQLEPFASVWESCVESISKRNPEDNVKVLINRIEIELPLLDPEPLFSFPDQLKRAYLVLCIISHFYVWAQSEKGIVNQKLPECLAKPWIAISAQLGIAPVLTHAAVVLYNWKFREGVNSKYPIELDDIETLNTASATEDEAWFYLVTVAIEAKGGQIPWLLYQTQAKMNDLLNHLQKNQAREDSESQKLLEQIEMNLERVRDSLLQMNQIMRRMYEKNKPVVFYEKVRPYLTGWENSEKLPHGLYYGSEKEPRKYAGGSAGQSALIQALDVFFGVVHEPYHSSVVEKSLLLNRTNSSSFENIVKRLEDCEEEAKGAVPKLYQTLREKREAAASIATPHTILSTSVRSSVTDHEAIRKSNSDVSSSNSNTISFQERMRQFMPGKHRLYLEDLTQNAPNFHDFLMSKLLLIIEEERVPRISQAHYNRLVQLFRECVEAIVLFRDKHIQMVAAYIIVQGEKHGAERGTGGTSVIPFLKQSRNETRHVLEDSNHQ